MASLAPANPDFERSVRDTFQAQRFLGLLGAQLETVEPGYVEIQLPKRPELTQHHDFFHGGATATLIDVAGGFAALSLMPADRQVLTVEFKTNLLAPGAGDALVVRGEAVRAGKTLTICQMDVYALGSDGAETLCASGLGTYMAVPRT
ncbi:MAG: PaaI family thioesterase [Pseudomonadota bacterium]